MDTISASTSPGGSAGSESSASAAAILIADARAATTATDDSSATDTTSTAATSVVGDLLAAAQLAPFIVCPLCGEHFQEPKVLACFHTFCKQCLEKIVDTNQTGVINSLLLSSNFTPLAATHRNSITCPTCRSETQLCTDQGVDSLLTDFPAQNLIYDEQKRHFSKLPTTCAEKTTPPPPPLAENGRETPTTNAAADAYPCTGCKTKDSPAVARCVDCKNDLCANCVAAHKFMHCFDGHRLVDLATLAEEAATVKRRTPPQPKSRQNSSPATTLPPPGQTCCPQHKRESLLYFCFTCNTPVCKECAHGEHPANQHHFEKIEDVGPSQMDYMQRLLDEARCKQQSLQQAFKTVDQTQQRLNVSFEKTQMSIQETWTILQQVLDEQRHQVCRDLETAYTHKQATLNSIDRKLQQTVEKLSHTNDFAGRLLRFSTVEQIMLFKKLLESRLHSILNFNPDLQNLLQDYDQLEFVHKLQSTRLAVQNTFGFVRQGQLNEGRGGPIMKSQESQQQGFKNPIKPISRPVVGSLPKNGSSHSPPLLSGGGGPFLTNGHVLASMQQHQQHHHSSALSPLSSSLSSNDYGVNIVKDGGWGVLSNGQTSAAAAGYLSGAGLTSNSQFSPPPTLLGANDGGGAFGLGSLGLSSLVGGAGSAHHAFSDSNLLKSQQFGGSSHSIGPFSTSLAIESSSTTTTGFGGGGCAFDKWPSSLGASSAAAVNDYGRSSFYGTSSSGGGPLSADLSNGGGTSSGSIVNGGGAGVNPFFFHPSGVHQSGGGLFVDGSSSSAPGGQQIVDLTCKGGLGSSVLEGSLLKNMSSALFPPKSQIKRHKMIYHCKFGEFGVMEGQFTEPSGVAVNAQNDVVVADTNNHRIQIFDKEGRFKFQFGECGKRDGQLLYPNRVAVNKATGDIVVTERSPTHQIQVYNQYGQFIRKFGANILQHPRGVTVDYKGRVVVVECKVMRIIIFDMMGNVLQKFGCSKYLEFPNGVVTNDKQEIFISDNRAHCVKVFNYDGVYLRQIGGEGLTNYPIGVGVNHLSEIVVADNHNNFNLTVFQQDGQLVNALESKVKHAQCFDVALLDDGSIVLASKDYRLYIYRYLQLPPLPPL